MSWQEDLPHYLNRIECSACGHTETWEDGDYFGERTDFDHHVCGHPQTYERCGPRCDHAFPGCANHPGYVPLASLSAKTEWWM